MENLQVGAYGWNHDSWVEVFYPDDMPEEWRLDFYANTYRAVLVPESCWLNWQEDDIDEHLDAVEGDFNFLFELTETSESRQSQLANVSQIFAERATGVVLFSEDTSQLKMNFAGLPVTLVSKSLVLNEDTWQWQTQDWICSGNPCGVVKTLTTDAKAQAALLKEFMQSLPKEQQGAAFIVKDSVDIQQLNNLKVIGELLGF